MNGPPATQPATVDEEADLARQRRNALNVLEMAKKVAAAGDPMAAQKMLVDHIKKVCKHYGNHIFSYDVINETINPKTGELEDTPNRLTHQEVTPHRAHGFHGGGNAFGEQVP